MACIIDESPSQRFSFVSFCIVNAAPKSEMKEALIAVIVVIASEKYESFNTNLVMLELSDVVLGLRSSEKPQVPYTSNF